jgi:recombination protein RecT
MSTNAEQSIQKHEQKPMTIKDLLESRKQSFAAILPKHVTPDRLIKVALNAIAKNPQLQGCSAASLFQSIVFAAELGLEPGGALGQMYLVPYGQVCTPIIGYRGLIELMRRSGQLAQIRAVVVHAKDKFRISEGIEQTIRHVPDLSDDPGQLVRVYVVARLKDGSVHVEHMTKAEIDKIRGRSRSGSNGPWKTDYDEMAKKTVVRRAAKYLPMSAEVAKAIDADDDDYIDGQVTTHDTAGAEAVVRQSGTEKAKAALKAKNMRIVETQPGETPDEALARAQLPETTTVDAPAEPQPALEGSPF